MAVKKYHKKLSINEKIVKNDVTVIIGIKNRYDYRIHNALASIRNQTYPKELIRIILVDYGSDNVHKKNFNRLCAEFSVDGIWTGINKVWNRSHCLNIAIKNASSKYLLCSDVDIMFKEDYILKCVEQIKKNPRQAIYCRMFDSKTRDIKGVIDVKSQLNKIIKKSRYRVSPYRTILGTSIVFLQRQSLIDIGGYDEFYKLWGFEDFDLERRLTSYGIKFIDFSNKTCYVHQFHKKYENVSSIKGFAMRRYINKSYCYMNYSIIRNLGGWGELTKPKNQFPRKDIKKLPGEIWAITSFFNPAQYSNKYKIYKQFRKKIKKQGLKIIAVELAFLDNQFELKRWDADKLIQLRGGKKSRLWQKERLLNIGLKHLPKECDKVIWIDCDIIFKDEDWVKKTSKLLEKYIAIQPFSKAIRLSKEASIDELKNSETYTSSAYGLTTMTSERITRGFFIGVPGFVWAARRDLLEKCGFYDRMILGGADNLFPNSFYGNMNLPSIRKESSKWTYHMDKWMQIVYNEVKGSVNYLPGKIYHMWHGDRVNRRYEKRFRILDKFKFNPEKDVRIKRNGILELCRKQKLNNEILKYFEMRREEGFRWTWKNMRGLVNSNVLRVHMFIKSSYAKSLGSIGEFLKVRAPSIYVFLKRFFPDVKY